MTDDLTPEERAEYEELEERLTYLTDETALLDDDDVISVRPIFDLLAEDAARRDSPLLLTVHGLETADKELNPVEEYGDVVQLINDQPRWWAHAQRAVTRVECSLAVHELAAPPDPENRQLSNRLHVALTMLQRSEVGMAVAAAASLDLEDDVADRHIITARRAGRERARRVIERAVQLSAEEDPQ